MNSIATTLPYQTVQPLLFAYLRNAGTNDPDGGCQCGGECGCGNAE